MAVPADERGVGVVLAGRVSMKQVNLVPLRALDVLESEPAEQSFEVSYLGAPLRIGYHSCLHGTDGGAVSPAPDRGRDPGHHAALQSGQRGVLG